MNEDEYFKTKLITIVNAVNGIMVPFGDRFNSEEINSMVDVLMNMEEYDESIYDFLEDDRNDRLLTMVQYHIISLNHEEDSEFDGLSSDEEETCDNDSGFNSDSDNEVLVPVQVQVVL